MHTRFQMWTAWFWLLLLLPISLLATACAAPVTLIERAVEARGGEDIIEDNRLTLAVNEVMADLGAIDASTEIYEQRLLVTGIFDNDLKYMKFKRGVEAIGGLKALYWHAEYMSPGDQERNEGRLLGWADALALDAKVGARLIGTRGVADVNFRVAADAFGTVYLLGRARSQTEKSEANRVTRRTEGVRRVVDYVMVRP